MSQDVDKQIEEFFSRYKVRNYPKGQILIHSGDEPQDIYYLASGKVRQYDISYRGDEIIVNIFKPGTFFPMLPTLSKLPNRFFFEAETEVEVYLAPISDSLEFLKSNPDVMFDLLTRVYIGLDGVLGRMFHLMSGSAKSRVLYELLIECRRFGEQAKNGQYAIAINEGDLAGRAGLSRETVSREIKKIGQDGLIEVSRKGIVVTDIELLEKKLAAEL